MSEATRLHVSKYLGFFAPVGAVGGFISDVLQPLASLSTYVFWTSLVASMGIIGLVITKTGYSGNFAGWDISYKKFLGLILGFGMVSSLFYELLYLKLWTVPIMAGILVIALVLGVWKTSDR